MAEKSLYDKLVETDIVAMLRDLWTQEGWHMRYDGKLTPSYDKGLAPTTPWRHIGGWAWDLDCLTNGMIFRYLSKPRVLGRPFVPLNCMDCWKVVARPLTVWQLFHMEEVLEAIGRPGKCGVEPRDIVGHNYGAYWWNKGRETANQCYHQVRAAIDAHPELGPDIEVIIKRACTEYELLVGPSDKWEIVPGQEELERLVRRWVATDDRVYNGQPPVLINHIHRRWIEFAFERRDLTYLRFTGGKPLVRPLKTYHEEINDMKPEDVWAE